MQLVTRVVRRFCLDFSNLDPAITTTGLRNLKISNKGRDIEGYKTKNFDSGQPLHTVIMIHEWWGLNKSMTETAEIFSNQNIRVFVPDLYKDEAANSAEVFSFLARKLAIK